MASLSKTLRALRQLGPRPVALYAVYQAGLKTGLWPALVEKGRRPVSKGPASAGLETTADLAAFVPLPERHRCRSMLGPHGKEKLAAEAGKIMAGAVRLFGAEPVPLRLTPLSPLRPWAEYETGKAHLGTDGRLEPDGDPKFTWEAGRFGWAFSLGRCYHLTGEENCAAAFWRYTEEFLDTNPPYWGPHWTSAQEVALRLIALTWALRVFAASPHSTPERQARLLQAVADHATRIPPTLVYARSQNNNHLLSEAAGLYTAACLMPQHPRAKRWRVQGWELFHQGIKAQIGPDGAYCQHSANYQRLMLQLALWVRMLANEQGAALPEASKVCLANATAWLLARVDPESGGVPNLGPNDGAYILPLTTQPMSDFRPVLEAAWRAFLRQGDEAHKTASEKLPGRVSLINEWERTVNDEMVLWFGLDNPLQPQMADTSEKPDGVQREVPKALVTTPPPPPEYPTVMTSANSWGSLRAVHFHTRPGHADQLHFDLWWQGLNVALDAGTYRYTDEAPWDNALTQAAVHNTVTVDGQDQMTRAGRFLYLDWAQATLLGQEKDPAGAWEKISAFHDGYRKLGIRHERRITVFPDDHWLVEDDLSPYDPKAPGAKLPEVNPGKDDLPQDVCRNTDGHTFRLHWLMPDLPWKLDEGTLTLETLQGPCKLQVTAWPAEGRITLVRGGKRLVGANDPPQSAILGWFSATYSVKVPALSLVMETGRVSSCRFRSEWIFPKVESEFSQGGA